MRKKSFLAFLLIFTMIVSACGKKTTTEHDSAVKLAKYKDENIDEKVLAGNESFGIELFHEIAKEKASENILLSPLSISTALMMTYNGSAEETNAQMKEVLGFTGIEEDTINRSFAALQYDLLTRSSDLTMNIANSLWIRDDFEVYDEFKNVNKEFFDAEATELDFDSPDASKTINKWVEDKTSGKIKDIVPANIDPDTVMFLINAIYFKGSWTNEFNPDLSSDGDFFLEDKSKVTVPFMNQEGEFEHLINDEFSAIRLPYGEQASMFMTIFVPSENSTIVNFREALIQENWEMWNEQFSSSEVMVRIPKFKLEEEYKLNDTLNYLGMENAFDPNQANFSKIASIPPNLYIGNVKHKTFIEVNEKGTEAAAATSVEIKNESAREVPQVNANRPFIFTIHDKETGTILFIGQVQNPSIK